jgi:peptide deformylase
MSVRPILKMGDSRLLRVADPVREFGTQFLRNLLIDMLDTMYHAQGAGLAAPQIGVNLRVVIFGSGETNPRYPEAPPIPRTILINPELQLIGEPNFEDWEGCLSVPGLRAMVPRHDRIRYRGMDEDGQLIDRTVDGFHARVVQHECDHLDGILYPMRVKDFSRFGYIEALFPDSTSPVVDD